MLSNTHCTSAKPAAIIGGPVESVPSAGLLATIHGFHCINSLHTMPLSVRWKQKMFPENISKMSPWKFIRNSKSMTQWLDPVIRTI